MSDTIQYNHKTFVPIRDLAREFSYSRDYVTRLAREGKVQAVCLGRRWYVEPSSLRSFAEAASIEQQVRQKRLSAERRLERTLTERRNAQELLRQQRARTAQPRALVFSLAALVCGVCSGWLLEVTGVMPGVSLSTQVAMVHSVTPKEGASSDEDVPRDVVVARQFETQLSNEADVTFADGALVQPVFQPEREIHELSLNEQGVLLLPRVNGATPDSFAIADMFSDPVRFTRATSGVLSVERVDRHGNSVGASIPLVVVPLERHTE